MTTAYTGEERWHVQVGPNDIKVMDLEQLDDAFRLDVISERTMVWTEGMGKWQSLGNVLSDADEVEITVEPEPLPPPKRASTPPQRRAAYSPPTQPASRQSSSPRASSQSQPPQRPASQPPAARKPASQPPGRRWHVQLSNGELKDMGSDQLKEAVRLQIVSETTKVWTEGMAQWLSLETAAPKLFTKPSTPPAARTPTNPPPPRAPVPRKRAPAPAPARIVAPLGSSVAPVAIEIPAPAQQPRGPRGAKPILYLAAAAAVLFGLHRNGVPYQVASVAGASGDQLAKARQLSATGLDTPIGIDEFIAQTKARHHLDSLSPTKPVGQNRAETLEQDIVEPLVINSAMPEAPEAKKPRRRASGGSQWKPKERKRPEPLNEPSPFQKGSGSNAAFDPLNPSLP